MEEIKTTVTALGHTLQYYQDWEKSEGGIWMNNAKTIDRYIELKNEHPDSKKYGVFFAFSNKQFAEGRKELIELGHLKEDETLYKAPSGMFGTGPGITKFLNFYKEREKMIVAECDPQEVYFYEYNNHESMISYDGDKSAIELIADYWGKDVSKSIVRFSAFTDIDKLKE